jgi:hypothetical protein
MHSKLTCDEIFDVLTRGPVSLDESPDIRQHLEACSGCRELAEAFRPAVGLLHESLEDRFLPRVEGLLFDATVDLERGDLKSPHASGRATHTSPSAGVALAEANAAARPSGAHSGDTSSRKAPDTNASWMPLLAAMLAGVALFGWSGRGAEADRNPPIPTNQSSAQLPEGHLPLVAAEGGSVLCCVECHRPNADAGKPAIALLAQSCMTCHVPGGM